MKNSKIVTVAVLLTLGSLGIATHASAAAKTPKTIKASEALKALMLGQEELKKEVTSLKEMMEKLHKNQEQDAQNIQILLQEGASKSENDRAINKIQASEKTSNHYSVSERDQNRTSPLPPFDEEIRSHSSSDPMNSTNMSSATEEGKQTFQQVIPQQNREAYADQQHSQYMQVPVPPTASNPQSEIRRYY